MQENNQEIYQLLHEKKEMSDQEKYRYCVANDSTIVKQKQKVFEWVAKKGLTCILNDTKWLELQHAIKRLPFPPPYIEKLLLDEQEIYKNAILPDAPWYFGDWSPFYEEGMTLFFMIEWIKVRPRHARHRGRLVAPEIVDETEAFEQILQECAIPYEKENGTFTIYGYK